MESPLLRLFVYGSLKSGFANYDRYCRGVRSMEEARIEGWLFQQPTGYPVLRIPEGRFLVRGSADYSADMRLQEEFGKQAAATDARLSNRHGGARSLVHGVVLTFANPAARLRAIDGLEEFHPGHNSRYERVLISVYSRLRQAEVPTWTYVAGDLSPRGRLIPTGCWSGEKRA